MKLMYVDFDMAVYVDLLELPTVLSAAYSTPLYYTHPPLDSVYSAASR